jgi:hypothetical protein
LFAPQRSANLIDGLRARLAPPEVSELRVISVLVGDDKPASRQLSLQAVAAANRSLVEYGNP